LPPKSLRVHTACTSETTEVATNRWLLTAHGPEMPGLVAHIVTATLCDRETRFSERRSAVPEHSVKSAIFAQTG